MLTTIFIRYFYQIRAGTPVYSRFFKGGTCFFPVSWLEKGDRIQRSPENINAAIDFLDEQLK